VSLLAIAVCQPHSSKLIHRHREQAHSYNLIFGVSVGLMLCWLASSLAIQLPHLDICGVAIRKTGGALGTAAGEVT
jgi:hypothetical protein